MSHDQFDLRVPFGVDSAEIVDRLSALANDVQVGEVFPQKFTVVSERAVDDFEMITVSLTYGRPRALGS